MIKKIVCLSAGIIVAALSLLGCGKAATDVKLAAAPPTVSVAATPAPVQNANPGPSKVQALPPPNEVMERGIDPGPLQSPSVFTRVESH